MNGKVKNNLGRWSDKRLLNEYAMWKNKLPEYARNIREEMCRRANERDGVVVSECKDEDP